MKYLIRIKANHGCWIAKGEGDPARTRKLKNARLFKQQEAKTLLAELSEKYPNREFEVEPF